MEHVERLCAVLSEETALCDALARVLRDQQAAVVRLRADAIVSCLAERESLQAQLLAIARERRESVRAAAAEHGATTTSAVELLPLLPAKPQAALREKLRRLRAALLETRALERETARLVGDGLGTVNELLRALRAFVPGARYGADAAIATPDAPERVDRHV